MHEAIPNRLWLGNSADARDIKAVLGQRIVAVIDLAMEEPAIQFPRDIVYCRIPLVDGGGNRPEIIRAAVNLTAGFIEAGVPTLVACGAGMSRSPLIVAAALAKIDGSMMEEALGADYSRCRPRCLDEFMGRGEGCVRGQIMKDVRIATIVVVLVKPRNSEID